MESDGHPPPQPRCPALEWGCWGGGKGALWKFRNKNSRLLVKANPVSCEKCTKGFGSKKHSYSPCKGDKFFFHYYDGYELND